jgi:ketose-bisphosphate aldolase
MPLVSLREVLKGTRERRFAVGAFNAMDHAFAEGILQAAEEMRTPVILAGGDFPGPDYARFIPYLLDRIGRSEVPVCLHFDHGSSFEACARAVKSGYSSVMIDGSSLPFEDNVALTKRVVDMAHAYGVDVEGELGCIGSNWDSMEGEGTGSVHTDPESARVFVRETGIDALAVAIGTSHGLYRQAPDLDFGRLAAIRQRVDVPLVMHGSSGLSERDFSRAIDGGICKINAFTALTMKVTRQIADDLRDTELASSMSHMISLKMTEYAKQEVMRYIRIFRTLPIEEDLN